MSYPNPNSPFSSQPVPSGAPQPATGKSSKRRSRKRGSGKSRVPLLLAAIVVVGALFATLLFVSSQKPEVVETDSVLVYMTNRSISVGSVLTESDFDIKSVPAELAAAMPDVVQESSEEALRGVMSALLSESAATRRTLSAGTILRRSDLTTPQALIANLANDFELEPGHRLMAIEATPAAAVGARIRSGDRIDIYAFSTKYDLATTLLTDVLVVDVELAEADLNMVPNLQMNDPQVAPNDVLPVEPLPGIYLVAVQTTDALNLIAAGQGADLVVTLRHPGSDETPRATQSIFEVFCPGIYEQLDVEFGFAAGPVTEDGEPVATVALPEKCRDEALTTFGTDFGAGPSADAPIFEDSAVPAPVEE